MPARGWGLVAQMDNSIAALRLQVRAIKVKEMAAMERRIARRTDKLLTELAELTASQSLLKKRKLTLSAARKELARKAD